MKGNFFTLLAISLLLSIWLIIWVTRWFSYDENWCKISVNQFWNTAIECPDWSVTYYNVPWNIYYEQNGKFVHIPAKSKKDTSSYIKNKKNDWVDLDSLFWNIDNLVWSKDTETENNMNGQDEILSALSILVDRNILEELQSHWSAPDQCIENATQRIEDWKCYCNDGFIEENWVCVERDWMSRTIDWIRKWNIFQWKPMLERTKITWTTGNLKWKDTIRFRFTDQRHLKCEMLVYDKSTDEYMIWRDKELKNGYHEFRFYWTKLYDMEFKYRCNDEEWNLLYSPLLTFTK